VKKNKKVPRCRRRIGPFFQADAWFGTDRVSPVKIEVNTETKECGMIYLSHSAGVFMKIQDIGA